MVRYLTLILTFCCLLSFSKAQNPTIDSLWKAVEMAGDLTTKVDEFNFLAEEYKVVDPKEAIKISKKALKIARKIDYYEGIFYAYNNLGTAFDDVGKGDSAFYYMDRALALAIDLEDDYALSVVKNNFGLHYLFRGNYPLALKYFQESLEGLEDPGYYMDPVVTYNNIGVIHEEQGNIEKAVDYYEKANKVALENGEIAYGNLGLGYIEQLRENYDAAIDFYQKSLVIYREKEDELSIGETLYYIGECYAGKGNIERAKAFLWDSFEIYKKLGLLSDQIEIYTDLGQVCEQAGKNEEALELYHQAAELGEGSEYYTILVPVFGALARQYALKKDYEKAYQYQLRYQELNATIYDNDTKERIAQMETSYELEVNKAEKERLQAEQSEREIAVKQRTILAVGSMLVTVLLAILVGIYYRENRRRRILNKNLESKVRERTVELEDVNNQLLESNQELERFTYIASHDLKEPLRNITSFVNLIERRLGTNVDTDLQEYMGYVTTNTRQMYNLIEDVLNFSQVVALDMREIDFLDLNALMIDVEATLQQTLQEKKGQLQIVTQLPSVKAHKTHIFMVFKNLIENGLKYNESEKPLVQVDCMEEPHFFCFSIRDNGIGINPAYHEQIFEMFKRMTTRDKYEGTGIGLAICKKIVSKYGGTFTVESEEGAGSTFYFRWPK